MRSEPLIWLYVKERAAFREIGRTMLARWAARLYAEHLTLLVNTNARVVVTERTADTLSRLAWSETGADVFGQLPMMRVECAAPGTARVWGLLDAIGRKLDNLATRDAILAFAAGIEEMPPEAWDRFNEPGEDLLRAYYVARSNYQLRAMLVGKMQLRMCGHPEA